MLGQEPSEDPEEQEFMLDLLNGWKNAHTEGRTESQANAVLTVLRVRGIPVSNATRERILTEKDLPCLERWLERAITAMSIAEVLDDPSR